MTLKCERFSPVIYHYVSDSGHELTRQTGLSYPYGKDITACMITTSCTPVYRLLQFRHLLVDTSLERYASEESSILETRFPNFGLQINRPHGVKQVRHVYGVFSKIG
jgi:hypothetical protein